MLIRYLQAKVCGKVLCDPQISGGLIPTSLDFPPRIRQRLSVSSANQEGTRAVSRSRQLLYERAKCVTLACVILCAETANGQTPWQAAPASPAPLIRPQQGGSNTQLGPAGTIPVQPPVTNRYTQQVQRPAFIPFDPNIAPTYKPVDLPPPSGSTILGTPNILNRAPGNSAVSPGNFASGQSLIDALPGPPMVATAVPIFPYSPTQPLKNRSDTGGLPGANQLLPRTPTQGSNQPQQNSAPYDPSGLPPFQGSIAGDKTAGSGLPVIPNIPLPNLPGVLADKTMLTSFDNKGSQSSDDAPPQITSDFWNAKLVAVVGSERVLAGDMAAIVEPIIRENIDRLKNKQQENEARTSLIRQLLPQFVEMKALQQEFFRDITGNVPPKELQKKQDEIMSRASKAFYDKFVPVELYRKHKVNDLAELEMKLQDAGLSIAIMKNHFLMQILAMQLEDKYVAETFEVTPAEILAYYNANIEKWKIPARAKWRQLTVRFDRHPSRAEADNLIKSLGNEVVLGGKSFESVARDSSEGHTAAEGGQHDWTTQGSLKSTVIDDAIFTLPPRRLSQIIEDEIGFHIIEVVERESARTQDMSEIQAEIRKTLSDEIRKQKLKDFRKKVLERVPVRTLWPEDIPGSRPLQLDVAEDDGMNN